MAESYGRYGVSRSGWMLHALGRPIEPCDNCGGERDYRWRVYICNAYHDYVPGSFCEGCARSLAARRSAAYKAERLRYIRSQF